MAEIVQDPQLRYTTDQTALAEMIVEFPGLRAEDPPATLKVVGWGNLAQEIQQQYHQGDRVIIEGRLTMNTVERQEGFKEKRAELTVQRIHPLGAGVSIGSSATDSAAERNVTAPGTEPRRSEDATPPRTPSATSSNGGAFNSVQPRTPDKVKASEVGVLPQSEPAAPVPQRTTPQVPNYPVPKTETDVDDIPF